MPRYSAASGCLWWLALVAFGTFLATFGSIAGLMVFFDLAGASGAITEPSVQSAAADGRDAETGARAAAMISAFRALSPMLATPLLAAPALVWGWRLRHARQPPGRSAWLGGARGWPPPAIGPWLLEAGHAMVSG